MRYIMSLFSKRLLPQFFYLYCQLLYLLLVFGFTIEEDIKLYSRLVGMLFHSYESLLLNNFHSATIRLASS